MARIYLHLHFYTGLNRDLHGIKKKAGMDNNLDYSSGQNEFYVRLTGITKAQLINVSHLYTLLQQKASELSLQCYVESYVR